MLVGALTILLAMAGLAYKEWKDYLAARAIGFRVLAVQNSLESLVTSLLESEAALRGFLVTGDARLLQPHYRTAQSAQLDLAALEKLLNTPGEAPNENVARLKILIERHMNHVRAALDLHQRAGAQAAAAELGEQTTIDEIRQGAAGIKRELDVERSATQARALAANRGALRVTMAGSLVLLVLLLAGYGAIRKRTLDRESALSGMRSLHELGLRLTQQSDTRSLLSELLRAAQAITGAEMGNIQLLDAGGALRIAAHHGLNSEFLSFFDSVREDGPGACGAAFNERRRIVVPDVQTSPIFAGSPAQAVLLNAGARAVQSTPLIAHSGKLVGMLSTHYRQPRMHSDRDLRLLDLLARQAADLIEKLRADEALRQSEDRYRTTFDNAAVGIAHVGLDGRWLEFNNAVCAITGYSREELKNLTFADLTHPDDLEADWTQARRLTAGEIPTYTMEKRYIRKDGSTVWVNLTVSLLHDLRGAPRHYVSIVEDINERKLAEQELRATKEQLQLVADQMAAGVTRCSRDLRYIWVSPHYAAWLGKQPLEIMGRPIAEVIGPRGYEDIRPYVERVLRGERVEYTSQVNFLGPGQRWIRAVYQPTYSQSQEVDGWIAVVTDITEEKRSAEQLRQSQRLESLGVLAGGIAHDFNNLLVGMLGNASLALDVLGPATPARKLLEDVIGASERAAGLTRQLLAYAGKEQIATRPVRLSLVVKEMTELLRASTPKNVHLALELDDALPFVDADQTQLQQVIMNLVINAAEAIPENSPGTVKIAVTARRPTAEDRLHALAPLTDADQEFVVLTVTDTGQGMTPDVQSRIFDPFFTTKFLGRGLGLSAVLGIVNAHHGAITLKTAPGAGTTISLLLRPAHGVEPLDAPQAIEPLRGVGAVLVVDDEETVRTVARRILEQNGYQALLAEDGVQAIEIMTARPDIAAVILDLAMPRMSGDQAAPRLRALHPTVPIILSSGYAETEARRKFDSAGITSFLQKPYTSAALLQRLATDLKLAQDSAQRGVSSSG